MSTHSGIVSLFAFFKCAAYAAMNFAADTSRKPLMFTFTPAAAKSSALLVIVDESGCAW